jgi:hypothetical protein
MIIIYLNPNQPQNQYNNKLDKIYSIIDLYHFGDIKIITERDPTIIIDLLRLYKPYQFLTYSLNEFDSTPTMISELIINMITKLDIFFSTIEDKLYFHNDNILSIYKIVFDNYKKRINYN